MNNNFTSFLYLGGVSSYKKTILLGLTAVLMTACGSNDSGGASSSGGSGECVDVSVEDGVGLTSRYKVTVHSGGKVTYSKIESQELKSFTKTSNKTIFYDDNENMIRTRESKYSISNGLMKVTKVIVDNVSGDDYEYTFSPYFTLEMKIGESCKGETWENEFDTYTKIDGQQEIRGEKEHRKITIEDVNVEKTVTAGTFNTIKMYTEDLNDSTYYAYNWIDIDTGITILSEQYKNGKLVLKSESLDIY